MSLAWLPPEEVGGSVITGYLIEMQKVDQVEWTLCNTTPTKMCEYTLTHMPQGAEYKFRVIACNAGGSGEPAEIPGVVKVQEMLGTGTKSHNLLLISQSNNNCLLFDKNLLYVSFRLSRLRA